MNRVEITGRLVKDSEVRANGSGNSILNFTVCVNEKYKAGNEWKERTNYIDCKKWNAEKLKDYLTKGRMVAVAGSLRQESWEKDGVKQSKLVVMAEHIEFESQVSKGKEKVCNTPEEFMDEVPF